MTRAPKSGWSRLARAAGVAIAVHALAVATVARLLDERRFVVAGAAGALLAAESPAPGGELEGFELAEVDLASVELLDDVALGPPLAARLGPADEDGFADEHPLPAAVFEAPGRKAAARGGDDRAGQTRVTGRADDEDLRAQIWNDPERYLLPRTFTGGARASRESIVREPERGFDERTETRPRARAGAEKAARGEAGGRGAGGESPVAPRWEDLDPFFDQPAPTADERRPGATRPGRAAVLAPQGDRATEAERRGPHADDTRSASASHETDPGPIELTRPSAGGARGTGTRGPRPGGMAGSGPDRTGTAATRAEVASGRGQGAVRARRQDPYFRRMYERMDRFVEYPKELALALEQGEVVVAFTLDAKGRASGVEVVKSSGFAEFDRVVTRAVVRASPFGPPPPSLRGSAGRLEVRAPYAFRNPLIR